MYRWVHRFTPLLVEAPRPCRHAPGDRWFVDETYVKIAGRWVYLYRAIDQYGQVINVLVTQNRDLAAATHRFFTRALKHGPRPAEVSTDRAPTYPRVLDELVRFRMSRCGAICEQPRRSRSWSAQVQAETDARAKTAPLGPSDLHRTRVCAESSPRPLRARPGCRPRHQLTAAFVELALAI